MSENERISGEGRSMNFRLLAIGALTGCLSLIAGGSAQAAPVPTWLSGGSVTPLTGPWPGSPMVKLDTAGNATAIWVRSDGVNKRVQASFRRAGGAFSPAVTVSEAGQDAAEAQLAVDAQGNAIAVWIRSDGTARRAQAAFRPVGGAFSAPVNLSAGIRDDSSPQVSVDSTGRAVAIWTHTAESTNQIVQAAYRSPGGSFGVAVDVSPDSGYASDPQVALDSLGNVTAVWQENSRIRQASAVFGGAFGAPTEISTGGASWGDDFAFYPEITADDLGNVVVAWSQKLGGSLYASTAAATRPTGGTFGQPTTVLSPGAMDGRPTIGVDAGGTFFVAGASRNNDGRDILASAKPRGGPFGAQVTVASGASDPNPNSSGMLDEPTLAFSANGTGALTWAAHDGMKWRIKVARLPAGSQASGFTDAQTLSEAGVSGLAPSIAMDPKGNGIVVWQRTPGGASNVQYAGLDGAAPVLDAVTVPANAVAGSPVAFSATSVDVWSPLGDTTWDFGDGTAPVVGLTPAHTYATAGTFDVTVRSVDALGFSAVATARRITVAEAPPVAGPKPPTADLKPPIVGPPVLTKVSLSSKRFTIGRATTPVTAVIATAAKAVSPPVGSKLRFTLSAPATVRIAVTRMVSGRLKGKKCVTGAKAPRRGRPCTVRTPNGTLSRSVTSAGPKTVALSGRIGARKLRVGRYILNVQAVDALGRKSAAVKLRFTLI